LAPFNKSIGRKRMKHLLLARQILRGLLDKETRALSLMMGACLLCAYFVLYTGSGALLDQFRSIRSASSYANISLLLGADSVSDAVLPFVDQQPFGEAENTLLIDLRENENEGIVIGWKGTRFTRWHAIEPNQSFFSPDQAESNRLIAIRGLGGDATSPAVELNGLEYEVVQQMPLIFYMFSKDLPIETESADPQVIIIPYRTFLEQGFHADVIRMDFAQPQSKSKADISRIAAQWFSSAEAILPPSAEGDARIQAWQQRYQMIFACMCALSLINTILLHIRLLLRERRRFAVYSFCGASRAALVSAIITAWGLCNAVAAIIAFLCVVWMKRVWTAVGIGILLPIGDAALIFLLTVGLSSIVLFMPMLKISSMNARPRGGVA